MAVARIRDGWFAQFGTTGPPGPTDVDVDYIRFVPYDELPPTLGPLTIKRDGAYLILCWSNAARPGIGRLQTADSITGPWVDAADQTNPQIITLTASSRFFRLIE